MNQAIATEAVKQTKDVIHGQPPFASMHKLDRAPGLQINARNQHVEWSACLANRNSLFSKISLEFAKPLDAVVKNRRSQRRISPAFAEHFQKRFRRIGASRGNDRHTDRAVKSPP